MIAKKHHVIPNVEELFEDMAGAVQFSKVDLTTRFHQLVQDEESGSLAPFLSHKRLNTEQTFMLWRQLCTRKILIHYPTGFARAQTSKKHRR